MAVTMARTYRWLFIVALLTLRPSTTMNALAWNGGGVPTPRSTFSPVSWLPAQPGFWEDQLETCHQVAALGDDDADDDATDARSSSSNLTSKHEKEDRTGSFVPEGERTRFREHPRCTARFGEVLHHAAVTASSSEERDTAISNARAVLAYVKQQQRNELQCDANKNSGNTNNDSPGKRSLRLGLTADLAAAFSSVQTIKFRQAQLEPSHDTDNTDINDHHHQVDAGDDYTPETINRDTLGRLLYSAIHIVAHPYLEELGLSINFIGLTTLLALCRAAASSGRYLDDSGLRLDAAISNHFNGVSAPGCRFLFSPRHGRQQQQQQQGTPRTSDNVDTDKESDANNYADAGAGAGADADAGAGAGANASQRADRIVVAFSSLGNGLVQHEFGASLAKINTNCNNADHDDDDAAAFDVLFVADPTQSWYQKDSRGEFLGFDEYEQNIRTVCQDYSKVSLIGDSMGGSAALLFSHLATDSVVALSPQVSIAKDAHVSRDDMTTNVRELFGDRLLQSVREATLGNTSVCITVHRGVEESDLWHTDYLCKELLLTDVLVEQISNVNKDEARQSNLRRPIAGGVLVVEHPECSSHHISKFLKLNGILLETLRLGLFGEN